MATLSGFFEWNIMTKMFSQQILENTNPRKAKPAQTEKEAVIEKNRDTSAKKFINGGKPMLNRNVTRNNVEILNHILDLFMFLILRVPTRSYHRFPM